MCQSGQPYKQSNLQAIQMKQLHFPLHNSRSIHAAGQAWLEASARIAKDRRQVAKSLQTHHSNSQQKNRTKDKDSSCADAIHCQPSDYSRNK